MQESESSTAHTLVWLITGASSGLGLHLLHSAVARGDFVIAAVRSVEKARDLASEHVRLLQLDVTDGPVVIKAAVDVAVDFFGRIDVLVNNAGTAMKALLEEGGSAEVRKQYDTNVFGSLDVTVAMLPHMRARSSGTIVLMGSRMSWKPENPTSGLYGSSKAAVRVLGETLAVELAPFSIRTLIVEPSAFHTPGILSVPIYEGNPIPAYDGMRTRAEQGYARLDGLQPGDPHKGMELLVDVVRGEGRAKGKAWPLYLPLGGDAVKGIREKCERMTSVLKEWGEIVSDVNRDDIDTSVQAYY